MLTGATVIVSPVAPADREALYQVARDPLIWALHPAHDRWRREAFEAYFDRWMLQGGGVRIAERASGRTIGASCFSTEFCEEGEVEIGWTFLARDHWGGATNREVKALMIGHALEHYPRAMFRVAASNLRSRRAMEKIGGVLTDRTMTIAINGAPVPHVIYTVGRDAEIAR